MLEEVKPLTSFHPSGINTLGDGSLLVRLPIPAEWREALDKVQMYFPQAVIAGGCLRDLYHGKSVKDVDIFIPMLEGETNLWKDQIEHLDPYYRTVGTCMYGQADNAAMPGFRELYAIYQLWDMKEPIELIFIQQDDATKLVSEFFDIDLCQIEYNGNYTTISQAFQLAVDTKKSTFVNVNRKDRQAHRLDRIKAKYPEYEFDYQGLPADQLFIEPYNGPY